MPNDKKPRAKDPRGKKAGGRDPAAEDPTREELAMFVVTSFVNNAANATAEWMRDGAEALEASLDKALKGKYTSSDLAKDSAALWARSVRHALRVLPTPSSDDGEETTATAGRGRVSGSAGPRGRKGA
jgi:hypothetical protein